ncbi:MAG: hypothetical protein HDR02_02690 [Lachnospiraceae bacterium]|nr:hypothetical protein [Lachnospiraceae bacterium]
MKNTKLYPFERNRYYPGKMLTSADFQAEQTYFNNKRRFINNLMYGAGVVCGCGVFSLDDLSLLVESGVAIDGLGREIVMESSVVKKLSAIEGFENLKTNLASLCLRYREEPVHTVYTMNQGAGEDGKEYEYNWISENYQLFLMDQEEAAKQYPMEAEFLTSAVLFENDDFTVKLVMPATVCRGKNVKLEIEVEKHSAENKKLTYHGNLQIPVFLTPEGQHELEIDLEDISLGYKEKVKKEYWLVTQDVTLLDTSVLLKSGSASAWIDGTAVETAASCSMKVMISDSTPRELVNREIGRMSLEMRNMGGYKDYVRLADLRLVRTESAYIIEEVLEKEVKTYITAPAQEDLRSEYLEYFVKDGEVLKRKTACLEKTESQSGQKAENHVPEVATGILEIPLGESARKGDIRYSGEIMHGLGRGNVYVDIGYEYITEDAALHASAKNTIYGNPDLFKGGKTAAVDAETAVKVMNDKGSFIVAARLLENVDYLVLTYRWIAIKFPAGNDLGLAENYNGKSISTDTPTVVMGTKESHYFHVKYNNMESCSVAYELTEPGSGEITSDGVYTAPAKEGVYEIRIYCIDMPIICTYAYAIVKKKGFGESEE